MEDRYQRLFLSDAIGIGFCSPGSEWLEVNGALCRMLGCEAAALIGRHCLDQSRPDHLDRAKAQLARVHADELDNVRMEMSFLQPGGRCVHVDLSIEAARGRDRDIRYLIVLMREHIEPRQELERLRLAAEVVSHAMHRIMVTDANARILEVNDAFTRITGYTREEVVGKQPSILQSGQHEPEFYAAMWNELSAKGCWTGEIWNRRKDGQDFVEQLMISAIRDGHGAAKNYVAMFSDVTPQKVLQRQLEYSAYFDALTNLPNRSLLADRLNQAMAHAERRGQRLAVVFLDLDGFKDINDAFGHDMGDSLLSAVANRLKVLVREGDTVARLGGDEFVIVAIDMGVSDSASASFLSRILSSVAQPFLVDGHTLSVSASLGVAYFPQSHEIGADQLLRQADQAMYQAKTAGKNRYHVFDAEHDLSRSLRQEGIERIRLGLKRGEFAVHFQPKVNMRTGEVLGAEALLRWMHPEKGALLPGDFLPTIEDHPLIAEIGEWVIDTVLTQLERWQAVGRDYSASVNVCAYQLQQAQFVDRLRGRIAAHPEVVPGQLELEVLETSALRDVSLIARVIEDCRSIGVHFALDDFGTGYSSLAYLKHLPATQLKIDKSFVQGMLDDPDDLAILEGIIGLAGAFRRQVVAEGVETLEHGSWLLRLGCDVAQGYAIGKPMPIEAFDAWATSWSPPAEWVHQRHLHRDEMPLLFAMVEHRAWVTSVDEFVRGRRLTAPDLDQSRCRFVNWLDSADAARFRSMPSFGAVESLHREVHETVSGLATRRCTKRRSEVFDELKHLFALRDRFIRKLHDLLNEPPGHAPHP